MAQLTTDPAVLVNEARNFERIAEELKAEIAVASQERCKSSDIDSARLRL